MGNARHDGLTLARARACDEFHTSYETVAAELCHYGDHLRGRSVYCNCDDPGRSNFWAYFRDNFEALGLGRVVATGYVSGGHGRYARCERVGGRVVTCESELDGDGDFRSPECVRLLGECDVVVTNPPFSLVREFLSAIWAAGKDYVVLGSQNVMTYAQTHSHITDGSIRFGVSIHAGDVTFEVPSDYEPDRPGSKVFVGDDGRTHASVTGIRWLTNLDVGVTSERMQLRSMAENLACNDSLRRRLDSRFGSSDRYPTYDNYAGAIEVPLTNAIPSDFGGVMGVPITFLDKYRPDQFEIVGVRKGLDGRDLRVGKVNPYCRLLVRNRKVAHAV